MAKKFVNFASVPIEQANVVAYGILLGKDVEQMLESLREASDFVDVFDADRKVNLLNNVKIADMGNVKIKKFEDITEATKKILAQGKLPLALGKSHLLTLYTIQAFPQNIKLVQFDAHGDIKDTYMDEMAQESFTPLKLNDETARRYNYTTWVRRATERLGASNIAIVGMRSCDEDDYAYIEKNDILHFTPTQIRQNLQAAKNKLKDFVKGSDVYITVDIDAFDPSIAPAVDNPEHNGMFLPEFLELLDEVCKGNVVGLDLVEIKSEKENKITEFLATWVVYQILNRVMNK